MGDRGNIGIKQEQSTDMMYMYSHWNGSRMPNILAAAFDRGEDRWEDAPYMTRIIFDTLINGDQQTTGYGLSMGRVCDNEHDMPIVVWASDFAEPVITFKGETFSPREFVAEYFKGER